jgi:hypothetical protein
MVSACTGNVYHVPPRHIVAPGEKPADTLNVKATTDRTVVSKFLLAYDASYEDDDEASKARELARYGMTLVDTRCDLFFEQIGRGAQTGDFVRRQFQSITAALVAALGLSAVGQDAITGVGIGSALGIQTLDNYSTVYFFSPDVSAVQKLVRTVFQQRRAELLSAERSPKSFDEAIGALRVYQNICTAHEIKRMVTEAIDPDRPIARFGEEPSAIYTGAANRAYTAVATALGADTVDLRQMVLLQMLFDGATPPLTTEEQDYLCSTLAEKLRLQVCPVPAKRTVSDPGAPVVQVEQYVPVAGGLTSARRRALDAGLATLLALVPAEFAAMRDRQRSALSDNAVPYRDARGARAIAAAQGKAVAERDAKIAQLDQRIKALTEESLQAGREAIESVRGPEPVQPPL